MTPILHSPPWTGIIASAGRRVRAFALAALALAPLPAAAQECLGDEGCTANDVRITKLFVLSTVEPCTAVGDTGTFAFRAEVLAGASERYDIGLFIARDGGDAKTGDCLHDYFPPPLADIDGYDANDCVETGIPDAICDGPYLDAEDAPGSGDECGDIIQNELTYKDLGMVTITCTDNDGDGFLDPIGNCVSWDNNTNGECLSVADAFPGTTSKCNCEPTEVTPPVPVGCAGDQECDDGNPCNGNETCDGGDCVPGTQLDCTDNDACTADSCDPASGCVNAPVNCSDGNACTADSCDPASGCVNTPIDCGDGNACTADSCDPASGCVNAPVNCNDNDACTDDSCNPLTGCDNEPIPGCGDIGACCHAGICRVVTRDECDANPPSVFYPGLTCDQVDCELGACCHLEICRELTRTDCDAVDPSTFFAGAQCADISCDIGACCHADICRELTETECSSQPLTLFFPDSQCADVSCERPGACCLSDGCQEITHSECDDLGGTFKGDLSTCLHACPKTGACCTRKGCFVWTQAECKAHRGTYHGDGTKCGLSTCGGGKRK